MPQGREVERPARGFESDAVVDDVLIRKTRERRVLLTLRHEIAVDLVRENDHPARQTQLAKSHQILLRPAVACRVLRVTENQSMGVVVNAGFQIVEIDGVPPVRKLQRALFPNRPVPAAPASAVNPALLKNALRFNPLSFDMFLPQYPVFGQKTGRLLQDSCKYRSA